MGWILFIIGTIGWHIGMYGMFQKAGITPWKAFIPFYNTWCIVQKCGIKKIWFWLQFIPIAGQFITIWITIIFVMHFGRFNVLHHSLTTFLPFIYFPYLGFSKDERWGGKKIFDSYQKPASREWIDAGAFAIVAATIIRTFVFEAYVIPTGSMEKTLLINDFLFVNKITYGQRMPNTPLSIPFVHNLIPGTQKVSYIKAVQIPYYRLRGFTEVKRNDVVVFNFPDGDTIINLPEFGSATTYYQVLRANGREATWAQFGDNIIVHPVDKTDNYIKRCVAVGGDTLQVKQGVVYINNLRVPTPEFSQRYYSVTTNGTPLDWDVLKDEYNIEIRGGDEGWYFGRYDVMCQSIAELKEGRNFSILEYNGCGAEPNHIYDSGYSLSGAYKEIMKHWAALYSISRYNVKQGIRPWPVWKGLRYLLVASKQLKYIKRLDQKLSF